jgi:hypothetical protein
MINPDDRPAFEAGMTYNRLLDNNDWMLGKPPTNRPLWQVMQDAYYSIKPHPDVLSEEYERITAAAEMRAIAKAMAEAEQRGEFTSNGLYGWLLAEAARAEAGE